MYLFYFPILQLTLALALSVLRGEFRNLDGMKTRDDVCTEGDKRKQGKLAPCPLLVIYCSYFHLLVLSHPSTHPTPNKTS